MSKRAAQPEIWSEAVGLPPHRVIVEEIPSRQHGIYLRWWNGKKNGGKGNWDKRSLKNNRLGKPLRREDGSIDADVAQWAVQEAAKQHLILTGGIEAPTPVVARPFTIGDTWAAISDPEKGKYPHKSDFSEEMKRALEYASTVWGKERPWTSIGDDDWTQLIRRRLTDLVARKKHGVRSTEITISRLITAVRWLRKTKRVPAGTAEWPDDWKADLAAFWKGLHNTKRDPEVHRPRYTTDEALAILAVSWKVDPRFGLLLDVGAEYRLGQVARCRRSDLNMDEGTLLVHGAGKKGGETIALTDAQLASVKRALVPAGYLHADEERWLAENLDYDLFPGGKLRHTWSARARVKSVQVGTWRGQRRSLRPATIRRWFREAEGLARVDGKEIRHIEGRGAYGIRRQHVKVANDEGISRFGLRAAGGWSSTKIPDEVYDEQENRRGRAEARDVRSRWRREAAAPSDSTVHTPSTLENSTVDGNTTANGGNTK